MAHCSHHSHLDEYIQSNSKDAPGKRQELGGNFKFLNKSYENDYSFDLDLQSREYIVISAAAVNYLPIQCLTSLVNRNEELLPGCHIQTSLAIR